MTRIENDKGSIKLLRVHELLSEIHKGILRNHDTINNINEEEYYFLMK